MKSEAGTYEGVCRYCGEVRLIFAETQEQADVLITQQCNCEGSRHAKKIERININAMSIVLDSDVDIIEFLKTAGRMILKDQATTIQLQKENIKYKASINAKGQIKFSRTENKQQELQD